MTKEEVAVRQLLHKAMKGETNAMKMYFAYIREALEESARQEKQRTEAAEKHSHVEYMTDEELTMYIRLGEEGNKQGEKKKKYE